MQQRGLTVADFGAKTKSQNDDYPDFALPVARAVAAGQAEFGLLICTSGVGMSMAANKVPGVRACLIHEAFSARQGVEDDDMNMICLGGRVVDHAFAWKLVKTFLQAKFSGSERFQRRLAKVMALEHKEEK